MRESVVMLCKCASYHRTFGVRLDKTPDNDWHSAWAFPLDEKTARREGYDRVQVRGSLRRTGAYPGCPFCHDDSLVRCGTCGRFSCYGGAEVSTCAWCQNTSTVQAADSFDVSGGAF